MFSSEAALDDALSEPSEAVVATLRKQPGDFILLGAAGKMGLSLARMIRRATENSRRVIGVSRFTTVNDEAAFHAHGIETIRCDLLDEAAVAKLPEAQNVIAMTGMKFGSTGNEWLTWGMNTYMPSLICKKFRNSTVVAFSTGNVYAHTPITSGGSRETDTLNPVGEYGMSAMGRERMYEYFSRTLSVRMSIIRLNYACDLRYGVLVDIARKVWEGQPLDLAMGHFNTIWQGDANAWTLQAFGLAATPPCVLNVTGPETLSVRTVAERMAHRMRKSVTFTGQEAPTALLSNSEQAQTKLAPLQFTSEQLIDAVADWVATGGRSLGKPTHFESRDGKF